MHNGKVLAITENLFFFSFAFSNNKFAKCRTRMALPVKEPDVNIHDSDTEEQHVHLKCHLCSYGTFDINNFLQHVIEHETSAMKGQWQSTGDKVQKTNMYTLHARAYQRKQHHYQCMYCNYSDCCCSLVVNHILECHKEKVFYMPTLTVQKCMHKHMKPVVLLEDQFKPLQVSSNWCCYKQLSYDCALTNKLVGNAQIFLKSLMST